MGKLALLMLATMNFVTLNQFLTLFGHMNF
jgi:hypothetical protein